MAVLSLYIDEPDCPPGNAWVLWQGRNAPNGICLEKMLEDNLLPIRKEHMDWAYEIGKLPIKNKTLAQLLEAGEKPSMWWTSLLYERHPRISPWLYPVYKLRCLELLLIQEKISKLQIFGGERKLKNAIEQICASRGITCKFMQVRKMHRKVIKTHWLRKIYNFIPAPIQAILRFFHWYITIKRHLPACNLPRASFITKTIVSYFPNLDLNAAKNDRFYSRYWQDLHQLINESNNHPHDCRWLFIRFPSPELDFKECIQLCTKFFKNGKDGFSFNYLEEFLNKKSVLQAINRWLKLAVTSFQCEAQVAPACHFKNSAFNFWSFAKKQWAESLRGWRSLERCLQNRAFYNYTQICGPQKWTLFALENCPWERMLTFHAHKILNNGPVIGAQHSTIRPTDFRYFDAGQTFYDPETQEFQPDLICGNGKGAIGQWQENGMPQNLVYKIEALRYLYLNKFSQNKPKPNLEKLDNIYIFTSFFAVETETHLELLSLAMQAGYLDKYKLIIKPHPYYSINGWLNNLPEIHRKKLELTSKPMEDLFKNRGIVWASNSTTVSLEAAWLHLPLMVMLPASDFDLCPIQDLPHLLRTGTLEQVKYALDNPASPEIPADYLDINPSLPQWRKLLEKFSD